MGTQSGVFGIPGALKAKRMRSVGELKKYVTMVASNELSTQMAFRSSRLNGELR